MGVTWVKNGEVSCCLDSRAGAGRVSGRSDDMLVDESCSCQELTMTCIVYVLISPLFDGRDSWVLMEGFCVVYPYRNVTVSRCQDPTPCGMRHVPSDEPQQLCGRTDPD